MRLSVVSILTIISICISLMGNAGEIKEMQVSPKIRVIVEEKLIGTTYKVVENKKIQFLGTQGEIKKEISGQDTYVIAVSPDKKKIAFATNSRCKYTDEEQKEIERMTWQARKEKRDFKRPEGLYRIIQDIVIYDEDGNKLNTITTNYRVGRLYCSDKYEIVGFGYQDTHRGDIGVFMLVFYDEHGNIVRSIDENEGKEKEIAIDGHGELYEGDKIVWVAESKFAKGGQVILFDLKGNIIWLYNDEHLSVHWLDIRISSNNNTFYVKAAYRDYKNPAVKKIWVIDKNGKLTNLLDGWEHEIK